MNGLRAELDAPRDRGTNPRAIARNPRARGTNAHPGKTEQTGQWRAAWRRLDRMTPERQSEILRELERMNTAGGLSAEGDRLRGLLATLTR